MTRYVEPNRDVQLQGHYAGMVSRLLAWVIDAFLVGVVFGWLLRLVYLAVEVLTGEPFEPSGTLYSAGVVTAFVVWSVLYFAFPWAMSGRSVGMAVLGIQVRRTDGSYIGGKRALLRIIALPFSFVLFGIGLLMGLFQRQRKCLHDVIADTVVVYSWDARRARLRLITRERI